LYGEKIKPVYPNRTKIMDQQKLIALLHQQDTEIAKRTPFCPGDHEIAAYFDRKAGHPDSQLSEHHLIDCDYCLARVAVLAQLHKNGDEEQVPETLLALAAQFGHQRRRRMHYAPVWVAAAVVIITFFTIAGRGPTLVPGAGVQPPTANPIGEDARQLRNISSSKLAPTILAPIKGANVSLEDLTIRWTGVPGSLYYDIRLVNAEGFMIWQDRIEETQWKLPGHLELLSGDQYFVRVDAYLAEAKSVSSRHVQFTIKERN
jgi:hypothetical protein